MSERRIEKTLLPLISFAGGSPVRMLAAQEKAKVLLAIVLDCGPNLLVYSQNFDPLGPSSRMSPAVQKDGSTPFVVSWNDSASKRYRSQCRRKLLELLIDGTGSSLLPTPNATPYGTGNNGNPHDHRTEYATKGKPSLWTMARRGMLPNHDAGPLAPRYVEWMMGFPDHWTKID